VTTKKEDQDPRKREIKKINSSAVSRGMSLFGMTVVSGARFVGLKVGDIFSNSEEKDERFSKFIADQVHFLVGEFGKLKGSFMKVGQLLSIYGEYYLPAEVNGLLKKLQSDSPPVQWKTMKKVIVSHLGEAAFAELEIDPVPLSAASMGQVYRATRKRDGAKIALKVQYPGVDAAIDNDLKGIKSVLALSKLVPLTPAFDEVFKEVRMMLKIEADYNRELEQLQHFRELLKSDPRYIVPDVYPEYSNRRILAMSMEEGIGVDSAELLGFSQERRNRIGATLIDLMYREMFEWRVVQTDCHFGNFRIRPGEGGKDDRLVLYDFGAMRKLPKRYMESFAGIVSGSVHRDFELIVRKAMEIGFLLKEDSDVQIDRFVDLCYQAVEPFSEEFASPSLDGSDAGDNPYEWGNTDLVDRLAIAAKDAIFAFKFRQPPREAVFLNRKMVGTYFFLRKIDFRFGPRGLMLKYVTPGDDR
jgi:predicted unusual protein kinase regulating ubiquinone biosynthesis (AarF/ABC1/UbiB family)